MTAALFDLNTAGKAGSAFCLFPLTSVVRTAESNNDSQALCQRAAFPAVPAGALFSSVGLDGAPRLIRLSLGIRRTFSASFPENGVTYLGNFAFAHLEGIAGI